MGHSHTHHHNHHHHGRPEKHAGKHNLSFVIAISLNLALTVFQLCYAYKATSMSLFADAGHNFGDVLGLVFSWVANLLLARGATARYSYGFKRTTILAGLSNALLLVAATAIIAYESIFKLLHPVMVQADLIIIAAVVGIIINGGTALLFMRGSHDDLNLKSAFLHLAYDALLSFAVVIGAIIIHYTHLMVIDPIVGLVIVVTIFIGTWELLRDSINLMMDAVPRHINHEGVKNYLGAIEGVTAMHDLHIWALSTNEIALTVHLVIPERVLTDENYEDINHDMLHDFGINHVTIQVERGTSADPCGQVATC